MRPTPSRNGHYKQAPKRPPPLVDLPRPFLIGLAISAGSILFALMALPRGFREPALFLFAVAVCLAAAILLQRPMATKVLFGALLGACVAALVIVVVQ